MALPVRFVMCQVVVEWVQSLDVKEQVGVGLERLGCQVTGLGSVPVLERGQVFLILSVNIE